MFVKSYDISLAMTSYRHRSSYHNHNLEFFLHALAKNTKRPFVTWNGQFDDLSNNDMSHLMTKPTKWHVCPAQSDQSSLSALRKLRSLSTHWAHSQDSDQTGWMPRPIWAFIGHTAILLVLSWGGSCHYIKVFDWVTVYVCYIITFIFIYCVGIRLQLPTTVIISQSYIIYSNGWTPCLLL